MVQGPPTSGLQQPVGYHRAIPLDDQWLSFSGAPLAARLPQRLRCECDQGLGPARGSHELHFEGVWPVDPDDRPEITSAQTGVRNVTRQYNGVQKIEHDSPRENGHQTMRMSAVMVCPTPRQ
jgi:hypothetical protein